MTFYALLLMWDFDRHPMTIIRTRSNEFKDVGYLHTKMNFPGEGFRKLRVLRTDSQTDRRDHSQVRKSTQEVSLKQRTLVA